MIRFIEAFLLEMKPAFKRNAAFAWFSIAFMGALVRTDDYGVTSFVRAMGLCPESYVLLLHFFHSRAWTVAALMERWWRFLMRWEVAWRLNGRLVMNGDHTKAPKDGRKMPGVATLHQDSETASKPSFFRGHHWGCIALVTHAGKRFFATPLWAALHEGLEGFEENQEDKLPKTVRIVIMAQRAASIMSNDIYLVLDAYFAAGPVFRAAAAVEGAIGQLVHIITRAKKNQCAYWPAPPKERGAKGRGAKYGEKVKLYGVFETHAEQFQTATAGVYAKAETIRHFHADLLWKPFRGTLRFFWFETSRGRLVLMTSDLSLQPLDALAAYCHRASIETLFDTSKNVVGAMSYHFWSKSLQRVSRRPIKNEANKRSSSNPNATRATLAAIEKYLNLHLLAVGMAQLIAMKFSEQAKVAANCWMRTPCNNVPSEFVVKKAISSLWQYKKDGFEASFITALIENKAQNKDNCHENERAVA